jgi:Aspartyl protease
MPLLIWCMLGIFCYQLCAPCAPPHPTPIDSEASEWVQPNLIRIPFRMVGALIVVRAKVDTLVGNFIFDTGASDLLLNYRVFAKGGPTLSVSGGVTGRVEVKGRKRLDSILIDNLTGRNITADLIDMSHIERVKNTAFLGIIGHKIFSDYEVLFDYKAQLLVLARVNSLGLPYQKIPDWEYAPIQSFPLEIKGHVAMLTLNFDKKKKTFGLDSGAEQNLLDVNIGKKFLEANFVIQKRVKLRGTGSESVEVLTGTLNNAQLDTCQLQSMATILGDMGNINTIYNTRLTGILGYEFLSQRPVSINYRSRKLTFYQSVFTGP